MVNMGISIHYTLITSDPLTVVHSVNMVKHFAKPKYRTVPVADSGTLLMEKIIIPDSLCAGLEDYLKKRYGGFRSELINVPEEPPFAYLIRTHDGYTYGYPSFKLKRLKGRQVKLEGVAVRIPSAEDFRLAFYKVGRYYICDDSTKTQPFQYDEVEANIRFHIWICKTLKSLETTGKWWHYYISDEGGYYESGDEKKLMENFELSASIIWSLASGLKKAGCDVEVGKGV